MSLRRKYIGCTNMIIDCIKKDRGMRKLVNIDWSLLSSSSCTYLYFFSLIGAKILNKINVLKMKNNR